MGIVHWENNILIKSALYNVVNKIQCTSPSGTLQKTDQLASAGPFGKRSHFCFVLLEIVTPFIPIRTQTGGQACRRSGSLRRNILEAGPQYVFDGPMEAHQYPRRDAGEEAQRCD